MRIPNVLITLVAPLIAIQSSSACVGGDGATHSGSTFCPSIYQPVVARLPDGTFRTFTNACEAMKAGATVVSDGPGLSPLKMGNEIVPVPFPFPW